MPHHDLPSPSRRLSHERTTVSQSPTLPGGTSSPPPRGSTHKLQHKSHTAGYPRMGHARNPSYGKNLHKLTKIHGNDENIATAHGARRQHTPSTSPSAQNLRRNASTGTLPRVGSKTSVKRNSSNLSLKRNGSSATQLGKAGRPTTPSHKRQSSGKKTNQQTTGNAGKFTVGSEQDEGHDDEWTEESASQSPSTTRQSAGPSRRETPSPDEMSPSRRHSQLPDSPPESPASTPSPGEPNGPPQQGEPLHQHNGYALSGDTLTSRILRQNQSHNLPPHMSAISANGTPESHTPPTYSIGDGVTGVSTPMPEDGISRFLDGKGSSGYTRMTPPISRLGKPPRQLQFEDQAPSGPPSPGPSNADAVRRAKSTGNLSETISEPPHPTADNGRRSPPSFEIDPRKVRRPGGNTAAKLELWRTQLNIEPPQGPPPAALRGFPGQYHQSLLSEEDQIMKRWQRAETELNHSRRFRNPVLEGAERVLKRHKPLSSSGRSNTRMGADAESLSSRGRNNQSRPASAATNSRRSLRFEMGEGVVVTPGEASGEEGEGEGELEGLLRRMWLGDEGGDVYTPT